MKTNKIQLGENILFMDLGITVDLNYRDASPVFVSMVSDILPAYTTIVARCLISPAKEMQLRETFQLLERSYLPDRFFPSRV